MMMLIVLMLMLMLMLILMLMLMLMLMLIVVMLTLELMPLFLPLTAQLLIFNVLRTMKKNFILISFKLCEIEDILYQQWDRQRQHRVKRWRQERCFDEDLFLLLIDSKSS